MRKSISSNEYVHHHGLARISSFPIGNQLSRGIAIQSHDFLVPLRGSEQFETSKTLTAIPGSVELSNIDEKANNTKTINQEGFGNADKPVADETDNKETATDKKSDIHFLPINDSNEKQQKLGSIFDAMKQAKFKTSQVVFEPSEKKVKKTHTEQVAESSSSEVVEPKTNRVKKIINKSFSNDHKFDVV